MQTESQLKGRWGELIAAFAFPSHWIVRPLPYDYGIDLQLEVFENLEHANALRKYRTTGGHLACQVKTTETLSFTGGSFAFVVDVADLELAESMGSSAPLVLLVVERSSRRIFYLCLNDYIEKILEKKNDDWRSQGSVTLHVPKRNVLDIDDPERLRLHWQYFKGLAFRAKFYAAASSFVLASGEIDRAVEDWMNRAPFTADRLAEMRQSVEMLDGAIQAGLSVTKSAALIDLRAETSPYAGLFENLRLARESIESEYPAARRRLLDTVLASSPQANFLAAQGDFEVVAGRVGALFATASTIGRVYEQTHREAGLRAKAIAYDVVP